MRTKVDKFGGTKVDKFALVNGNFVSLKGCPTNVAKKIMADIRKVAGNGRKRGVFGGKMKLPGGISGKDCKGNSLKN